MTHHWVSFWKDNYRIDFRVSYIILKWIYSKLIPIHSDTTSYGPTHTFNGINVDFYLTRGGCTLGKGPVSDANFFCAAFYGAGFTASSYKKGLYSQSKNLGWQMHKVYGCRQSGLEIDGTKCMGANKKLIKCRMWKSTSNFEGLYEIICSAGRLL